MDPEKIYKGGIHAKRTHSPMIIRLKSFTWGWNVLKRWLNLVWCLFLPVLKHAWQWNVTFNACGICLCATRRQLWLINANLEVHPINYYLGLNCFAFIVLLCKLRFLSMRMWHEQLFFSPEIVFREIGGKKNYYFFKISYPNMQT